MDLILENELNLSPTDTAKNFELEFELKSDYKSLKITHNYNPRVLEDVAVKKIIVREAFSKYEIPEENFEIMVDSNITNLITLSLVRENEYIGVAHRGANEQVHIISDEGSSFGFINTKINNGTWKAIVNVHFIGTDHCRNYVKIEGEKEGTS